MLQKFKKIFLVLLLGIIMISFTGCLGFPGVGKPLSDKKHISNVAYKPNDSQGVFKTEDGGKTWSQKITVEGQEKSLDQYKISSMVIDPQNNNVLYVGTMGNGLYKSTNGADSWHLVGDSNNLLKNNTSVFDIAIEKGNSNIVYLATLNENRAVLLKSVDGGESWVTSYVSTEYSKQVNRVFVDPIRPEKVYIGTEQGGLLRSDNKGDNWVAVKWFDYPVRDFEVDFVNDNGIFVLTSEALYKTTNARQNIRSEWVSLVKNITETSLVKINYANVSSLTMDNKNPLILYLTYHNLVLVTNDGGKVWKLLDTITPAITITKTAPNIRQIGLRDNNIYYGAGNALYKSLNRGATWSSMDIPIKGDARYIVSDTNNINVIYVGAFYESPA